MIGAGFLLAIDRAPTNENRRDPRRPRRIHLRSTLDHDDFGLNQSKITNVIDFNHLERNAGGKVVSTFPHPALADQYFATTGAGAPKLK
jgi:hypothetical protein